MTRVTRVWQCDQSVTRVTRLFLCQTPPVEWPPGQSVMLGMNTGQCYLFRDNTLAVPGVAPLGEVVDGGKLDERREDKGVAHGNEPVHGRGVGHLGQGVPGADAQGGHGQYRCHPCKAKGLCLQASAGVLSCVSL